MKNQKTEKARPQRPPPSRPAPSPSWTPWLPPLPLAGSAAQRKTGLSQCKRARQSRTKRSESRLRKKKRGEFKTHATCDVGLRRRSCGDRRVWAGCRRGGSVLHAPSRRRPDRTGISPPVRSRQRYLRASGEVNASLSTRKKKTTKRPKQQIKITFRPKVRFEGSRLFEVLEDFDQSVALSDGIPMETYLREYNAPESVQGFRAP